LVCDSDTNTGTGIPPVTVAEPTLGVNDAPDYYDAPLVDGSDLPISITSDKGCSRASCPVDLVVQVTQRNVGDHTGLVKLPVRR